MTEFCEHETFRDICGICHRDKLITALRAEVERLGKDYQTARDAYDKLLAENDRFKISLSDTVQQTQDQASEITSLRAENERLRLALEQIAGYRMKGAPDADIARAALEERT